MTLLSEEKTTSRFWTGQPGTTVVGTFRQLLEKEGPRVLVRNYLPGARTAKPTVRFCAP